MLQASIRFGMGLWRFKQELNCMAPMNTKTDQEPAVASMDSLLVCLVL